MNLELLKERETPLLSRKRITLMMDFKGTTPSRNIVKNEIATKLKADKKLVVVKHIYTRYGAQKAKVIAHVYTNEKDMKKIENDKLLAKHVEKKEEPKAEEKPAATPETKPAEAKKAEEPKAKPAETKEEPKAENKPTEQKTK